MGNLFGLAYCAVEKVRGRYRGTAWHWPTGSVTRLSYDSRDRVLNGVPLGAPLERLKRLGPAAWFSYYRSALDLYCYRPGLIVSVREDKVGSSEAPTNCPDRSWHPFAEGRLALMSPAEK